MAKIRALDMDLLDDLFDMRGGYVLDFTDRTFGDFFRSEIRLDIDDPRWEASGRSKAKRLRYLLQTVDDAVAVRILTVLWEYRETKRRRAGRQESVPNAEQELWELLERLGGSRPAGSKAAVQEKATSPNLTDLARLACVRAREEAHLHGWVRPI